MATRRESNHVWSDDDERDEDLATEGARYADWRYADWYHDGENYVVVDTGPAEYAVRVGCGHTPSEAWSERQVTPYQGVRGAEALRWWAAQDADADAYLETLDEIDAEDLD